MRVLHVAPYSPDAWAYGGIPRVLAGLAGGLARRGHEVTLCATDAGESESRLSLSPATLDRSATFRAAANGIDTRLFRNVSNSLAYRFQLFTPLGLRAYLRRNLGRFDVVHLHADRNLPVAFAASACLASGVPFVFTPNGTAPRIESKRAAKWLWDRIVGRAPLERAARVLAVTEAERRELLELGVDARRIARLPNPVELAELHPPPVRGAFRARHGLGDARVVLYLGRISPRKRLDTLAEAFARLPGVERPGEDRVLVIAGGEATAPLPNGERTRCVGVLRGRERLEALADADAVSYAGEREIFGLVPLEAILCGTPVVVADDSGCGELIGEIGGGLVVAPGDPTALASALGRLLEDSADWRLATAAAAERVRSRFGADVVAARLEKIYEEVVAERGAQGLAASPVPTGSAGSGGSAGSVRSGASTS